LISKHVRVTQWSAKRVRVLGSRAFDYVESG
jgi:hypothetical protein